MQNRFKVFYDSLYYKQWIVIDRQKTNAYKALELPGSFEKIAEVLLDEHYEKVKMALAWANLKNK